MRDSQTNFFDEIWEYRHLDRIKRNKTTAARAVIVFFSLTRKQNKRQPEEQLSTIVQLSEKPPVLPDPSDMKTTDMDGPVDVTDRTSSLQNEPSLGAVRERPSYRVTLSNRQRYVASSASSSKRADITCNAVQQAGGGVRENVCDCSKNVKKSRFCILKKAKTTTCLHDSPDFYCYF